MINLPEVRVSAQRKELRKSTYYEPGDLGSQIITIEDIKKSGITNLGILLNTVLGVNVNSNGPIIGDIRIRSDGFFMPLLVVDDIAVNSLYELPDLNSIEQIDIFKGANPFGMRGASGAIVIHTKRGGTITDNTEYLHIKQISPLGYQQPLEFYAPKYDTPEKRNVQVPDLRTTIHWQPVVQTDSRGEASFEFYTADESTSYTVIIEGLANDGSIISQEGKIWIKDK